MSSILDVIIYIVAAIRASTTSYMTLAALEFRKNKMRRPDPHKMWEVYEKNRHKKTPK